VDPLPLNDRVALVTGGSRGIGAAVAETLAQVGAAVAVNYRSDDRAAAETVGRLGRGATSWRADVAKTDATEHMVRAVEAHHGRIDVVVVNAGVWRGGSVESLTPADWTLVLETSLGGAFNVVRAVLPGMKDRGYGRIVVISSVVGLIGFRGDSAYAAAKAGLLGFVKSVAKEAGRDGVTVNAVAPGLIETDMAQEISQTSRERMLRRASIRRMGQPDEVAAAVRYLVLDGDYVTGQTLVVDGGLTL
jgi:3-oxoacyl-[acyl-carrier protein] reductase